MVVSLGAWLKTGGAPAAPAEKSRRANKAGNYGLSGHGTLQQMWERACPRCAARAALDLKSAEDSKARASRSAARAALDLKGAEDLKASASRSAARAALDLIGAEHTLPSTCVKVTKCLN